MPNVLIIAATFYQDIAEELIKGAKAELDRKNISYDLEIVPGAFEIPAAVRMGIESKKYDGYVTLGCVIRGETTHYDYVCLESARGLNDLAINFMAPIGYGILTVESFEQAWERAGIDKKNKGAVAAKACIEMMSLKKNLLPAK